MLQKKYLFSYQKRGQFGAKSQDEVRQDRTSIFVNKSSGLFFVKHISTPAYWDNFCRQTRCVCGVKLAQLAIRLCGKGGDGRQRKHLNVLSLRRRNETWL